MTKWYKSKIQAEFVHGVQICVICHFYICATQFPTIIDSAFSFLFLHGVGSFQEKLGEKVKKSIFLYVFFA